MKNLLAPMVQSFIKSDFDNLILKAGFNYDNNNLYFNNNTIITRNNKGIYIDASATADELIIISILNSIEGINAHLGNSNNIIVNGVLWDGKKTNINIFI